MAKLKRIVDVVKCYVHILDTHPREILLFCVGCTILIYITYAGIDTITYYLSGSKPEFEFTSINPVFVFTICLLLELYDRVKKEDKNV